MNNTPSLNEKNKNSTMDPNMLTKYYKLKLMNDFMNIIRGAYASIIYAIRTLLYQH